MREKGLVEAELTDCIQDIASAFRDGATMDARVADLLDEIAAQGKAGRIAQENDIVKILRDVQKEKFVNQFRKTELTERYTRLLFEYLMFDDGGNGSKKPFNGLF